MSAVLIANPMAFYIFAVMAIALSLVVVLHNHPVTSAFCLVLAFFCFSAIFALLGQHLVAALQILVYAGAIMVLFVFVIMLLKADVVSLDLKRNRPVFTGLAVLAALGSIFFIATALKGVTFLQPAEAQRVVDAAGGNTRNISRLMFSEYILPFELTSVLLLGSIVGVVSIAKRKLRTDSEGGAK